MYLVKKLLLTLLFPYPLGLALTAIGLVLLWRTGQQKAGRLVATIGVLWLIVTSNNYAGNMLAETLEERYPPLYTPGATSVAEAARSAKWIVVLAASHSSDARFPANQRLGSVAIARLAEGIRLHRGIPGSRLLLSGGSNAGPATGAELMAEAATALGERREDMVLEIESRDTEDEARLVHDIVGDDPLVLVTSAIHLPRAMFLFSRRGMKPIPGPADRCTERSPEFGLGGLFPNHDGLANTTRTLHEYLGIGWSKLRGKS